MTEQNSPGEVKEVHIQQAQMTRDENGVYLGQVVFGVNGHQSVYEITFHSKRGKEWDYSLHFAGESRVEEEMLEMDSWIEENDDLFDHLLDAAWSKLPE
ncbi:hypothetical protein [Paenibacillus brasilensis]|uniref:DUF1292 domain-containing protein n=1 Tax=Paenibacillus brasilensis TaxID=128574 RepID=A0ABU0KUZ1_9BACL|nr:hypothetical protein [Paenibacillus brasilensis]MDQ0493243.1 hypothetical protein [Paenibacillus brasilensis]